MTLLRLNKILVLFSLTLLIYRADTFGKALNEEPKSSQKQKDKFLFIAADALKVRKGASIKTEVIGVLYKGNRVKPSDKMSDANQNSWIKITTMIASKTLTGWILEKYTTHSWKDLLKTKFRDLDFSERKKLEYQDNPKVLAKGIYLSIYSAYGKRLDRHFDLARKTQINSFVIDIKDERGKMLYKSDIAAKYNPLANKRSPRKEIDSLIERAKKENIYLIGRIPVFKDDRYSLTHPDSLILVAENKAPYYSGDGLKWINPYYKDYWNYVINLACEAAKAGFREIQFDYIRFPDTKTKLYYRNAQKSSRPRIIQEFLKQAYESLSDMQVYVSADVFGLVGSTPYDLYIGQYWESISNVVDYISPMMYPSHYARGFHKIPIPDAKPYETIYSSTLDSIARNNNLKNPARIRPWIQAFSATWVKGHIKYTHKELYQQIFALESHGIDEYLLWNARCRYESFFKDEKITLSTELDLSTNTPILDEKPQL